MNGKAADVVLDTAATGSLHLTSRFVRDAGLITGRQTSTKRITGIDGSYERKAVVLPTVTIAGEPFGNVEATILSLGQVGRSSNPIDGVVGVNLLRQFNLIIDYGGNQVWLTPNSEWRHRYAGWKALPKLEYMDGLMGSLRDAPPPVQNPQEVDALPTLRLTLRQHYRNKRRHYGVEYPNFYDRDLRRLFSDAPEFASNMTAAQFIGRIRRQTRRIVADWTGIYQYTIDQVIEDMFARCRELKLRLTVPEEQARHEFTVLLTVQTMNHLHSGGHRLFL